MIDEKEQNIIDSIKSLNEHMNKKFDRLERMIEYNTNVNKIKPAFKKLNFKLGDLLIDINQVNSGIVIAILKKHIKILWSGKQIKISKWELNSKVLKQEYKHFPTTKNNTRIK